MLAPLPVAGGLGRAAVLDYDWFGPADLPRLKENRTPAETLVHDLIVKALRQV
jgi:hypothetical protein